MSFTIQQFFKYGLDRDIPALIDPCPMEYPTLELGPGKRKEIPTTHKLKLPDWDATKDAIPFRDETFVAVHAYQFMEHVPYPQVITLLKEIERVLVSGGVFCMVVPYYNSAHMAQALDHRSFWSEETWHWLFGNEYYDDHAYDWKLEVHACFIMGVVERNLDLFTQLVKRS